MSCVTLGCVNISRVSLEARRICVSAFLSLNTMIDQKFKVTLSYILSLESGQPEVHEIVS